MISWTTPRHDVGSLAGLGCLRSAEDQIIFFWVPNYLGTLFLWWLYRGLTWEGFDADTDYRRIVHLLKVDFHAACFYLISSYKQLIFMPISVWSPRREWLYTSVLLSANRLFSAFSLQTLTPIAGLLFAGWPHCCKWRDYPSQSYFTDPSTPLQRKALLCWSHWFVQWGNTIFWHKHRFMQNLLNSSKQWLTLFLHL